MNDLSEEEDKIVNILRDKFNPQAVVLVGSQADGTATAESDWDIFLFCGERRAGIEIQEQSLKIDVNFSAWPQEDGYFDTGFGPVQPIKVLFDESEGRLTQLLSKTETAYKKGPVEVQEEISALHMRAFERYLEKLKKYENDEAINFYYKGKFLDLFLTVWFEQQNMWAPSPAKALTILIETQPEVFDLIQDFIRSSTNEALNTATELAKELSFKKD